MKKMERLIGIIYALRDGKRLSAGEIANIFEVSDRTIYRDIDALSQLGVPVNSFEGTGGGYTISENYFLPSIAFREYEVLYLLICLKIGELISMPSMHEDYESLKYKLLNILDSVTKEKYLKLLERIKLYINKLVPNEYSQDITKVIIESFFDNKNICIEYDSPKKGRVERKITPYILYFDSGGWYLDSHCHLKNERRLFRLDRIKSIKIAEDTYPLSLVDDYFSNMYKKSGHLPVRLRINRSLYNTVKNDNMFINSIISMDEDGVQLDVFVSDYDDIIEFVLHNYNSAVILEPRECIDKMKEICKKILETY